MTLSKEIDHSDHPPAIVSSESVDRRVRRDPYSGTDHHPAGVSSERVERQVRGDPYSSETSEELLHEATKIPKPNKNKNHEQVRGDLCGIDSYPVTVSSKLVEWQERRDPCSSEMSEELLTKPTQNPNPNENEDPDLERGDLLNSDIPE